MRGFTHEASTISTFDRILEETVAGAERLGWERKQKQKFINDEYQRRVKSCERRLEAEKRRLEKEANERILEKEADERRLEREG